MKTVLTILCTTFLTCVLMIGGCVYVAKSAVTAVSEAFALPDYVTAEYIHSIYGEEITAIDDRLKSGEPLAYSASTFSLSEDVLAIYANDSEDLSGYENVYSRYATSKVSHRLSNGIGVGRVKLDGKEVHCLVYDAGDTDSDYFVYFRDHQYAEYAKAQRHVTN